MSSLIRRIMNRISPPEIPSFKQIKAGNYTLKAVYDAKLDENLAHHPNYSVNFAKLVKWYLGDDKKSGIVDIGANMGDTVALIRSQGVNNKIYCVEGNSVFFDLLKTNATQFQDVKLINYFLSDKDETITSEINIFHGTAQYKETGAGEQVTTKKLDSLADTELEGGTIKILKVDTDGYDVSIINGALEIIKRDQPMIYFEYDTALNASTQTCLQLLLSLADYGYSGVIFYDNFGTKLIHTDLQNTDIVTQLDSYVVNGKSAFPYYDVAVFSKKDDALFREITGGKYDL